MDYEELSYNSSRSAVSETPHTQSNVGKGPKTIMDLPPEILLTIFDHMAKLCPSSQEAGLLRKGKDLNNCEADLNQGLLLSQVNRRFYETVSKSQLISVPHSKGYVVDLDAFLRDGRVRPECERLTIFDPLHPKGSPTTIGGTEMEFHSDTSVERLLVRTKWILADLKNETENPTRPKQLPNLTLIQTIPHYWAPEDTLVEREDGLCRQNQTAVVLTREQRNDFQDTIYTLLTQTNSVDCEWTDKSGDGLFSLSTGKHFLPSDCPLTRISYYRPDSQNYTVEPPGLPPTLVWGVTNDYTSLPGWSFDPPNFPIQWLKNQEHDLSSGRQTRIRINKTKLSPAHPDLVQYFMNEYHAEGPALREARGRWTANVRTIQEGFQGSEWEGKFEFTEE